jgi:hypothetical protein
VGGDEAGASGQSKSDGGLGRHFDGCGFCWTEGT